jgi:Tfp pilus assembly protein PilX
MHRYCPAFCHVLKCRSQRGVALVVVMAIVVLMVGVVMAFFSQSLLQRQISKSSASQTSVEMFANGALNTIVNNLQQEIVKGSAISSTNNVTLYIPLVAVNAVPSLAGATGGTGCENLIKRSVYNVPVFADGPSLAAQSPTTDVSANGRYITRARWNKPLLMAKVNPDSATDLTPVSTFNAPDWILVNCGGGNPTSWDANMIWSSSAANTNVVVGRYAYTIYNEGGLLDANVAGYPADAATVTGTAYSYKSALAFADLTQINLTQSQINALVGWRNQASLNVSGTLPNYALDTSAMGQAAYCKLITSNNNGFLATSNTTTSTASGATDHRFISRQNLINFLLNGVAQNTNEQATLQNALQYLGTFSREVDAPSYTPSASRPKVDSVTDDQFNPSLIDTRVVSTFTRSSDGQAATVGEPLLKHRFPLSRLAWIGYNGPNGATAAQIYDAFGLTWSGGVWVYNHGNSSQILKLSEVAAAKREPDFFELLQAGIVIGSLGKTMPSGYVTADAANEDANTYYQIVQIAANLVDQYDADSYPTRISFGGKEIDGIENLPYLSRVWEVPFRIGNDVGIWYQPEVWNPHANVANAGGEPSIFRYVADGKATAVLTKSGTSSAGATTTFNITSSDAGVHFLNTSVFSQPQILSASVGATASGSNSVSSGGTSFLGVFVGSVSNAARDMTGAYISINSSTSVSHRLQYYNGSDWVTYCEFRYVKGGITTTTGDAFDAYWPRVFPVRSDPRTDRFGVLGGYTTSHTYYAANQTLRPQADNGYSQNSGIRNPSPTGWVYATGPAAYLGTLSDNKSTSVTRYADPDGVIRGAMGV